MKKVEAFIRHEAFEPIRMELLSLGFPSLSIMEVKGSGRQKGITERYRGAELTNYLRPKVKIECVVATRDVQTVVDTILKHARTGLDRRRQGVRPARRGGVPHPHGRVRRGDAAGAPRARRRGRTGRVEDRWPPPSREPARPPLARRAAAGRPSRDGRRRAGRRRPRPRRRARRRRGRRPVAIVVPRLGAAVASRRGGPGPTSAPLRRYVARPVQGPARRRCRAGRRSPRCRSRSGDEVIGGVLLLGGRPRRRPEATEFLHLAAVASLTEVAVEEAKEEVEQNLRGSFLEELRARPTSSTRTRSCAGPRGSAATSRAAPSSCAPS